MKAKVKEHFVSTKQGYKKGEEYEFSDEEIKDYFEAGFIEKPKGYKPIKEEIDGENDKNKDHSGIEDKQL